MNIVIDNAVKKFDCFGEGWAFDNRRTRKSNVDIDLSKLTWNKGYTLFVQHFGVLDPIFGDYESNNPWDANASFVEYVLKTNNLVTAWLELDAIKDLAEDLEIEASVDNLDLLVAAGIDRDADYYIKETITDQLHFGNDFALCGITDEEYFKDILIQLDYDIDDKLLHVVYLG